MTNFKKFISEGGGGGGITNPELEHRDKKSDWMTKKPINGKPEPRKKTVLHNPNMKHKTADWFQNSSENPPTPIKGKFKHYIDSMK